MSRVFYISLNFNFRRNRIIIQTEKIILTNGRIYSSDGLADNLIIENGRIKAVSSDEISGGKIVDLHGRTVLPGFCDCNVDFVNWAAKQEVLNLSSCQTLSDIISALASYSRINPKPLRNWYIAKNLPDGIEINHDDIDNVVSEIPCLIFGNGFAILNTQAMILLNSNEKRQYK